MFLKILSELKYLLLIIYNKLPMIHSKLTKVSIIDCPNIGTYDYIQGSDSVILHFYIV